MAKVIVSKDQVEEYINECGLKITSFSWNAGYTVNRNPEVEWLLGGHDDLEYEDDALVETDEHDIIVDQYRELSVVHDEVLEQLNERDAELIVANAKIVELQIALHKATTEAEKKSKPWWK